MKNQQNLGQFFEDSKKNNYFGPDLKAETLKKVFACITSKKEIKKLAKEEAPGVFEVGHYLGAPKKMMRRLTFCIQDILPHGEQPALVQCGAYLNSIRNLYGEGILKLACKVRKKNDNDINPVDLLINRKQKIDSLDGIELVAEEYKNTCVKCICLDKNRIKIVDFVQLFKLFSSIATS